MKSYYGVCEPKIESKNTLSECFLNSAPTGIRTPVLALKGLRPSPLDDGGNCEAIAQEFLVSPKTPGFLLHGFI